MRRRCASSSGPCDTLKPVRPLVGLLALALAGFVSRPLAAQPPKLAVLIVVDQMRADYVDRFLDDWSGGLKRLVTRGAWFRRAAYPYLETLTCAGHATIATGAFPLVHGIFQNTWFDRSKNALVTCTDDASVKPIAYGGQATGSDSPAALRIPSLADEMRRQRGARVVSLSLKARSAIMLAGHGGDAVTWLSETLDGWETSTAYASGPVSAVSAFVAANPIEADFGKVWTPSARYREPDAGLGEAPPPGWTATFPHALAGLPRTTSADAAYYLQWERSPFADAYLGRMAAALAASMQLGKHDGTDVLAVSFSSPDLVGHAFGPRSQEIRDMFVRLDRTIGGLLDALDMLVGADQYVLALSADHGVAEIPEQLQAEGRDGGRIDAAGIVTAIERAAQTLLGPGRAVARMVTNDIYFRPDAFEKLSASPSTLKAVIKAAQSRPGVGRAFYAGELAGAEASRDALLRAAALSFVPGRSGDIVIAPKPGWMFTANGTTHGSANDDDQRVPIFFYGAGVKAGRYNDPATPADIAPTLAGIVGIKMPQAGGKVLASALIAPALAKGAPVRP